MEQGKTRTNRDIASMNYLPASTFQLLAAVLFARSFICCTCLHAHSSNVTSSDLMKRCTDDWCLMENEKSRPTCKPPAGAMA